MPSHSAHQIDIFSSFAAFARERNLSIQELSSCVQIERLSTPNLLKRDRLRSQLRIEVQMHQS
jgi:hypothetical protein